MGIIGVKSFEEIVKEYKEYKELIEGIGHGNLFHLKCARIVYDGFNVKFHVPGVN